MEHRYTAVRRITLIGALVNALQGILKVVLGYAGQSYALVADGVHSLSDLLTDALVIFAARYGGQAADYEHPYGHGRIETIATVVLALLIIFAGVGIMLDASSHLFTQAVPAKPNFYVIIVAFVSVIANEWIFRYTLRVADRIDSALLRANAWHSRSDAASSLVVLVGVSAAILGFTYLDAVAALLVAVLVIKMGWQLIWSGVRELIDTGLDRATVDAIKNNIIQVPGVRTLHQLRTRSAGSKAFLDVHILVDSTISVSEGHFIGQQVHLQVTREFPAIADVTVHVDPEDDEVFAPSSHLPSRNQLMPQLQQRWQTLKTAPQIKIVVLHYLAGKIYIDIYLPVNCINNEITSGDLLIQYQQALKDFDVVGGVELFFK